MIAIPLGVKIFQAMGQTDMGKGFDGLAAMAQKVLSQDRFPVIFSYCGDGGEISSRCCIGTAKACA